MAGTEDESTAETEVERLAYAIWESEGRPEGRDHEHWMRAKEMLAAGETVPTAGAPAGSEARPVQPGFEDVPPGIVPDMKERPQDDLDEGPGGRFAQQLDELPEERETPRAREGASADDPLSAGYE